MPTGGSLAITPSTLNTFAPCPFDSLPFTLNERFGVKLPARDELPLRSPTSSPSRPGPALASLPKLLLAPNPPSYFAGFTLTRAPRRAGDASPGVRERLRDRRRGDSVVMRLKIRLKTRAHAAPRAANFKFRKLRMHPSRQPLAWCPAVQRSLKRVKQMRCVRESRTVARRTSPRRRVRAMCAGCGFENHTRSVLYFCEPRAPARGLADGIRRR